MNRIVNDLAAIVGRENVLDDHASRQVYAAAAAFASPSPAPILPLACVCLRHPGQIGPLLKFCSGQQIPLVFRGGGTGFAAPPLPLSPDTLVILTSGLNRIYEIDPINHLVSLQPGVTASQLEQAALEHGLFYPPMPWSAESATIGGSLALNVCGAGCLKYGPAANYLFTLDAWTTSGEKISCNAANATAGPPFPGLPLASLFCGSSGTLGLIGDCRLRLLPIRPKKSLLLRFPDLPTAAAALTKVFSLPAMPITAAIFDAACAAIILKENDCADSLLILEYEEPLPAPLPIENAVTIQPEKFTASRKGLLPALRAKGQFRLQVLGCLPSQLPNLLDGISQIAAKYGLKPTIFGQGSRLFVLLPAENNGNATKDLEALELLLNNAVTTEADADIGRRQWQQNHNSAITALSSSIRQLFDPQGLLKARPLPQEAR